MLSAPRESEKEMMCQPCQDVPALRCGGWGTLKPGVDDEQPFQSVYSTGPRVSCASVKDGASGTLSCPIGTRVESVLMASYGANNNATGAHAGDDDELGKQSAVCHNVKVDAKCGGEVQVQCPLGTTMTSGGHEGSGMVSSHPSSDRIESSPNTTR